MSECIACLSCQGSIAGTNGLRNLPIEIDWSSGVMEEREMLFSLYYPTLLVTLPNNRIDKLLM